MNPQSLLSHMWRRNFAVALFITFLLLWIATIVSSESSSQEAAATSTSDERKFEDITSERVPIKVKLRNERAFKDMKNKDWVRELEIEVKNTGSKPIYFMVMNVDLPEAVDHRGYPLVFQLSYGRKELVRLDTAVESGDIPLKPGESVVLKIPEKQVKAFEATRHKERTGNPRKVVLNLQLINFGDGTGQIGHDGAPIPDPTRRSSKNAPSLKEMPESCPPTRARLKVYLPDEYHQILYATAPARFSRVNFSPTNEVLINATVSPFPDLCGCQNISDCFFGVIDFATCPCDNPNEFVAFVPAGSCSNPFGRCRRTQTARRACDTQFNGTQVCTFEEDFGSCAIADPTPTPTSTPTPDTTPTPTPDPTPEPCPGPEPAACCVCVTLPPAPGQTTGPSAWDCGATFCPPNTPLAGGCITPDANGNAQVSLA